MTDRRPYERLPGETAKAFQAFTVYRDLGIQRSFESVANQLSKSATLIRRWAAKYNWGERIECWDIDQDYERQKEAIAAKRKEYRRN